MTWVVVIEGFLLVVAGLHVVSTRFLIEDLWDDLDRTRGRLRELEEDVRRGLPN